ncbi:MAG: PrsW family intramembrane metalloprotease [Planctomycetaceae bacterium]|jgi:RsiW-degrading membrane proteinase PrsW (M82 family)|nr:PrsW family intramembrane metalloprotease [Planctomycetaceae bacterium]
MNHWYYYDISGNKKGPVNWDTLRHLALSGKIVSNTQIITPEGQTSQASKIDGLTFGSSSTQKTPSSTPNSMGTVQDIFEAFRTTDFKKEIIPIDPDNAAALFKDSVFWVICALGVLPVFITSLQDLQIQLYGLTFFFAMLWGGVLRGLVLKSSDSVVLPVVSFFITGIIGVQTLLFTYRYLPAIDLSDESYNGIIRLFGFIFQVGFCEELCKIAPVIFYLIWKRQKASPMMMMLIGVFSGLGFAAFENIGYAMQNMERGLDNIVQTVFNLQHASTEDQFNTQIQNGGVMAILHIHSAIISTMLRSVSLVFAHSIWTGIFSYYIVCAVSSGKRFVVFCCLGLAVPMVLHGVYDWLCDIQLGFAALIIGFSFTLFYGYLSKIRQQLHQK